MLESDCKLLMKTVAAQTLPRKRTAAQRPEAADLLAWYDRHRRELPWRAVPGETPDPYRVWLSEIMLQQTTVKTVAPYFARFLARWPNVRALAAAPLDDVLKVWAGLGYYARARNLYACAQAVVERHGGRFPRSESELAGLPGIGRYTAAAVAAIAFNARTVPVDGNVERVVARMFAVAAELPAAKPELWRLAQTLTPEMRSGDFAQALMDLGATICTPKQPACALCPWMQNCAARARGWPDEFPVKTPKPEGRLRRGAAFVLVRSDSRLLVRTRPLKGLLGGMTEVPTTEWTHDFDELMALSAAPLQRARWRRRPGAVTHVFTHFPLELVVYVAEVPMTAKAPQGARWVALADVAGEALPTVMRKVIAHGLDRMRVQT
jgi:A/G-specific adenine glycosylase